MDERNLNCNLFESKNSNPDLDIQAELRVSKRQRPGGKIIPVTAGGKEVYIQVPQDVKDGSVIHVKGKGKRDPDTGETGDLYVSVRMEQGRPFPWKIVVAVTAVAAVAAAVVLAASHFAKGRSEKPHETVAAETVKVPETVKVQEAVNVPETVAVAEPVSSASSWEDNVLMRSRVDSVIPLGSFRSEIVAYPVFGSEDLIRSDICRVVFEDTLRNVPNNCWDVSEAKNNSVLAWAIPASDGLYELHIAAEGGINGKLACEDLFCGYQNLTSIAFNDCFHTEEAEDFSRMFYYCWQLEKLDLDGFRTDSARNLSEMFANCFHLRSIDVSSFDTTYVEDTSGMFSRCDSLKYVDITGFDLYRVRDISYMFNECPAGDGLEMILSGVWFRNVDRYDNFMDEGVLVNGEPWIRLFEPEEQMETQSAPKLTAGDVVIFGRYEQDNLTSNGPEAIEWLVLDVQGDKALLLSRYALDSQPYNRATANVTWESCSMRSWLNSEFLNTAFTAADRSIILQTEVDNGRKQGNAQWQTTGGNNTYDYAFLLSYEEADAYFYDQRSRVCSPTDYAVNMGAHTRELDSRITDAGWWWLRSPGEQANHAAFVNFDGGRYSNMVSNGYLSVRPALWIDLSKV